MHQIPLILLGGRDRRTSGLPDLGEGQRRLEGYKSAELELGGRPLISLVIERMEATGVFAPIFVAGPQRIYGPLLPDHRVIDTDGSFGENLEVSVSVVERELSPHQLAVATSDILPDPAELEVAMADLMRHQPLDFWMPHVPVPEGGPSLGASDWKPRYRLQPAGAEKPLPTLPGHLVITDLEAVRLPFVYHLFNLFYETRNQTVGRRRLTILRKVLGALLREDLGYLLAGKRPYAFFDVVYHGLTMAAQLKAGRGHTPELEERIRKLFYKKEHQRLYPKRRGRIAMLDVLSLARDIDTEKEAEELRRHAAMLE